ncbi:hypothetical protein LTR84_003890 [Exophiala bonariae]|uniref:Uncharacterized protein n=1 Tax=Exophiala bonariae TaxID=1690606 RepID=A0AAV9NAH1_9EURO|nr:hypothetical protein LTR84_003890 [Exophiala bonariae]
MSDAKGHSLEEINTLFDDEVAGRLSHLSEQEKRVLDARILGEVCVTNGQALPTASEESSVSEKPFKA